jgi:hypothetical protein
MKGPSKTLVIQESPFRLGVRNERTGVVESWPLTRPTSERYERLVRKLVIASGQAEGGGDRLRAAEASLAAVVEFLHSDEAVVLSRVTRALVPLVTEIDNLMKGAPSSLLQPRNRQAHRAAGASFELAQGELAALLEGLVFTGKRTGVAADWLANRVRQHKITCPNGNEINPTLLRRWREDIRGKEGLKGKRHRRARESYDRVLAKEPARPTSSPDIERWCDAHLKSLHLIFPETHPLRGKG